MLEQINEAIKTSMKNKDKFKLSTLRMLKSAVQNESINLKKELSDSEIETVIKKQLKMRKETLVEFQKINNVIECDKLNEEIDILLSYLPKQLTEDEIILEVEKLIEEVKPEGAKDMGKCMKYASEHIQNADMTLVSKLIKEKLT